jgi:hypothetical protein
MLLSFLPLFAAEGRPINAASILPGLLRDFGDVADVLAEVAPRRMLLAAGVGELPRRIRSATIAAERFSKNGRALTE